MNVLGLLKGWDEMGREGNNQHVSGPKRRNLYFLMQEGVEI
jgi:hypothetical protein